MFFLFNIQKQSKYKSKKKTKGSHGSEKATKMSFDQSWHSKINDFYLFFSGLSSFVIAWYKPKKESHSNAGWIKVFW